MCGPVGKNNIEINQQNFKFADRNLTPNNQIYP